MTLTATAGVPAAQAGLASGLVNTTRQIGGAVGPPARPRRSGQAWKPRERRI